MTDVSVTTVSSQVERRSWLIPQPGGVGFGYTEGGTLDVSAFTAATHYPNGFFPSGLVVSEIGANSNMFGPYNAAGAGRHAILFSSTKVPNPSVTTVDVGAALLRAYAVVKLSKLPIALDATGQGKLPLILFIA